MNNKLFLNFLLRTLLLVSCFVLGNATAQQDAAACNAAGCYKTHKGAWFDIKYPADFLATDIQKSSTRQTGADATVFLSPDKSVEFYIYSPQWGGVAPLIEVNPKTERLDATQKSKAKNGVITWTTISAVNGDYLRSYQDFLSEDKNVHWVIGIKYRNQASYNRYKEQYLFFKKSLQQYSDGR